MGITCTLLSVIIELQDFAVGLEVLNHLRNFKQELFGFLRHMKDERSCCKVIVGRLDSNTNILDKD